MPVSTRRLTSYLDELLHPGRFKDYCPNGLQVEGRSDIQKVVTGVTACQALLDEAVASNADAVLVHHGYFWRGEGQCITGMKKRRLHTLLAADINLLAYHLPLDLHPELGNNAQLGKLLGFSQDPMPRYDTLLASADVEPCSGQQMALHLSQCLGRDPLHIDSSRTIARVLWCTGGAQSAIDEAISLGADAYISGEISESTVHSAREAGIHYFAAGHHATERFGVKALGEHLADQFGLECEFVDIDNPA